MEKNKGHIARLGFPQALKRPAAMNGNRWEAKDDEIAAFFTAQDIRGWAAKNFVVPAGMVGCIWRGGTSAGDGGFSILEAGEHAVQSILDRFNSLFGDEHTEVLIVRRVALPLTFRFDDLVDRDGFNIVTNVTLHVGVAAGNEIAFCNRFAQTKGAVSADHLSHALGDIVRQVFDEEVSQMTADEIFQIGALRKKFEHVLSSRMQFHLMKWGLYLDAVATLVPYSREYRKNQERRSDLKLQRDIQQLQNEHDIIELQGKGEKEIAVAENDARVGKVKDELEKEGDLRVFEKLKHQQPLRKLKQEIELDNLAHEAKKAEILSKIRAVEASTPVSQGAIACKTGAFNFTGCFKHFAESWQGAKDMDLRFVDHDLNVRHHRYATKSRGYHPDSSFNFRLSASRAGFITILVQQPGGGYIVLAPHQSMESASFNLVPGREYYWWLNPHFHNQKPANNYLYLENKPRNGFYFDKPGEERVMALLTPDGTLLDNAWRTHELKEITRNDVKAILKDAWHRNGAALAFADISIS